MILLCFPYGAGPHKHELKICYESILVLDAGDPVWKKEQERQTGNILKTEVTISWHINQDKLLCVCDTRV
jgi:hypothetical protein